jgi:hypothetical protein
MSQSFKRHNHRSRHCKVVFSVPRHRAEGGALIRRQLKPRYVLAFFQKLPSLIGMTFIEGSGFARWADTNRLVVLFPQVEASILNPKACWDWWGYTGKDFLTKDAPQIAAIWRMVERLASGSKTANVPAPFRD